MKLKRRHFSEMAAYDIPLVSSNLRPQEMIIQMADTLEFLDQVSSDIFSKVALQIQDSRARIVKIHRRVEVAQAKIDGLKGSRKATKIFSSSRFPGNFQSESKGIFNDTSLKFNRTSLDLNNLGSEANVDGDLIFYPTLQLNGTRHQTPAPPSSVSELLIFNTEDLAFQQQSLSDKSSKSILRRKHDSEMSVDTSLGDAPWSISQREQLERSNPLNFSYIPGLGDVPELDLPLALPDLPGVADDLAYNEDVGPGIAPSLIAALPDLSQLTENRSMKYSPVPPPPPPIAPVPSSITPQPPKATPPPPPPPPPPPSNLPLPPPPPPPPLAPLSSAAAAAPSDVLSSKTKLPPSDGMRSNLMAAIREAGGAGKLKSSARVKHTQAVKEQQQQQQQQQNGGSKSSVTTHQAPTGDLMADLFNKLSMRRKGISGQNSEVAGPMERISAMIPPPPPPGAAANASSSDDVEDWK